MINSKGKQNTIPLTEIEKEFYAYLGLLSVKFSEMENNLNQIVAGLIHNDDLIVTALLTEDNTLHKNLELLKKVNKFRDFQVSYIKQMVDQIGKVKITRNLFIHGVWSKPVQYENDILSHCNDVRLKYSDEKDRNGEVVSKRWQMNEHKEFRLSYIIQEIHRINDIIVIQKAMLKKLEAAKFN
jgi:hypothetical protein